MLAGLEVLDDLGTAWEVWKMLEVWEVWTFWEVLLASEVHGGVWEV